MSLANVVVRIKVESGSYCRAINELIHDLDVWRYGPVKAAEIQRRERGIPPQGRSTYRMLLAEGIDPATAAEQAIIDSTYPGADT